MRRQRFRSRKRSRGNRSAWTQPASRCFRFGTENSHLLAAYCTRSRGSQTLRLDVRDRWRARRAGRQDVADDLAADAGRTARTLRGCPKNNRVETARVGSRRGRQRSAKQIALLARRDQSSRASRREEMTRDFVGYGAEPPHARWPGEARVAVNFVINFEEGSELSYPAGDGVSETGLIESASTDAGNRRDLAAESMFEYGARVGGWRLHRIFTGFGLPVTLFAWRPGIAGEPAGRRRDRRD